MAINNNIIGGDDPGVSHPLTGRTVNLEQPVMLRFEMWSFQI